MGSDEIQGFRLSPQQRRSWSVSRGDGGSGFGGRCAALLEGSLDEGRLAGSLRRLVERHEALRTTYRSLPGMRFPVQVVTDAPALDWRVVDGPAQAAPETAAELLFGELAAPYDLEWGPVARARLARLGPDRHVLALGLPALGGDGATLDNMVRELAALYGGRSGEELGEPVRYVQFSEWQNSLLEEVEEGAAELWGALGEAGAMPRFPFERPEGDQSPFLPRVVRRELPPALADVARRGAAALNADLDLLLLAAWQAVLGRFSGMRCCPVAVLDPARPHEALVGAVGLFARWLPLQLPARAGRPFRELAADLREARERALEWAEALEWGPDGAGERSLAAGFEVEEPQADLQADGLRIRPLLRHSCFDRLTLRLVCAVRGEGLSAALQFDAARVDEPDAERLLDAWTVALEAALADPERPVEELDLLGEEGRRRLLVERNRTDAGFPRDAVVHRLFEQQVDRTPEAPAVAFEGRSLSYAELDRRANRLARVLRARGVGPDVPVALCLERSLDLPVALLGVLKAGGAYVPLEPNQPQQRLDFMLEEAAVPVGVVQAGFEDRLGRLAGRIVRIDSEPVESASGERLEDGATARNLCYVVFTSGSTGRPKGVAVEHRQMVNYTLSAVERLGLETGLSFANVSTFAADLGNTGIFPTLLTGGCLHVLGAERVADAEGVADYFAGNGIEALKVVPSHFEALQAQPRPERALPRRRLIFGGEALRPGWIEEVLHRAGDCEVYNHYGPSETAVGVLTWRVEPGGIDPRCSTVPLGRPIANARVYVLGPGGRPVPEWVPGELHVGGECLSRGYFGRPDLTAERFVPDPFGLEAGGRLYRTGDLVRTLPGGEVEFLGRSDDQVKFHGFRVELNEIRLALNRVEGVRDSVVSMLRDDQGRDVLVAYYVSRHELEVSRIREELGRVILEETLPNLFVHLRRLPLTLNGKVNYAALPSLEEARKLTRREYVAPSTATEEVMAGIWAEVLGHERVSVRDSFFELGGHSLLATRVISRQREAFQVELPLRSLFETPTVERLAQVVDRLRAEAGGAVRVDPIRPSRGSELDRQLAELELLSDEEAKDLLQGPSSEGSGTVA